MTRPPGGFRDLVLHNSASEQRSASDHQRAERGLYASSTTRGCGTDETLADQAIVVFLSIADG